MVPKMVKVHQWICSTRRAFGPVVGPPHLTGPAGEYAVDASSWGAMDADDLFMMFAGPEGDFGPGVPW